MSVVRILAHGSPWRLDRGRVHRYRHRDRCRHVWMDTQRASESAGPQYHRVQKSHGLGKDRARRASFRSLNEASPQHESRERGLGLSRTSTSASLGATSCASSTGRIRSSRSQRRTLYAWRSSTSSSSRPLNHAVRGTVDRGQRVATLHRTQPHIAS